MSKTNSIALRISDIEKEKIKKAAEEKGMSMSEWVLYLIRKELDK